MKKLVIIGANNFQLPLILKAEELGIETHAFAWEEGALGKDFADFFYPVSINEKELILDHCKRIQPDGIISIGSDLAMVTVNYIANELNLIGNSLECTKVTTNKYLMRKRLSEHKLPCPLFSISVNNEFIAKEGFSFPVIVKPTDRSGSRGVTKVNNHKELRNAIERALDESFSKTIITEEFIEGQEYSIEMISWKGEHHFLRITEKETTGAPYFVEKAQHQPALLLPAIEHQVVMVVKNALSALGVEYGASHSEIIIKETGEIFITEIGARMGGDFIGSDLVQLSTGFDFVKAVIDIALGNFDPKSIKFTKNNYSGVYFAFPKPGRVERIINKSSEYPEIVRSEIYCKVGDQIPEIKESALRPACFLYQSKDKKFFPTKAVLEIVTE